MVPSVEMPFSLNWWISSRFGPELQKDGILPSSDSHSPLPANLRVETSQASLLTAYTVGILGVLLRAHVEMQLRVTSPFVSIATYFGVPPYFNMPRADCYQMVKATMRRTVSMSCVLLSLFPRQIRGPLNFRPSFPCQYCLYLSLHHIDSQLVGLITGSKCCSDTVPQTTMCTTPSCRYTQPLYRNCQSEKGILAGCWLGSSCGKQKPSASTKRYCFLLFTRHPFISFSVVEKPEWKRSFPRLGFQTIGGRMRRLGRNFSIMDIDRPSTFQKSGGRMIIIRICCSLTEISHRSRFQPSGGSDPPVGLCSWCMVINPRSTFRTNGGSHGTL